MKVNTLISTKRLQIEKSKRTVLMAVVGASVVISLSVMTAKFLWDLGRYYSRVVSAKEDARGVLRQNLANVESLKQKFAQFEDPTDDITSKTVLDALPSVYDFPALVTSLDSIAKRSGVSVTAVTGEDLGDAAAKTASDPQPVAMPLSLSIKGDYESLAKFIDNLHRSIRPFKISNIEIRGSDESISAEISLETNYQPAVLLDVEKETIR